MVATWKFYPYRHNLFSTHSIYEVSYATHKGSIQAGLMHVNFTLVQRCTKKLPQKMYELNDKVSSEGAADDK